ncbi:protein hunchback [Cimex lectularius]|uniref:Protein hunchback n=1 Tax=Cimex lectularius TaxID=79782 RepID=A0A8I6SSZ7_CIMLE|nr:protein hunchback [Cimex lectularius]
MPSQESPPAAGPESKSPRLTPPGSIPSPCQEQAEKNDIQDGGSQSSNSENEYFENGDSLRRLQMALQRTGMMPEEKLQCPMCEFFCNIRSQFNEHLVSHETKCNMCDFNGETADKLREHMKSVHDCDDENMWIDDEPGLNTPKVNSQGKVKTFRCKQCDFSAVTKLEFWEHSRSHIKQERILNCPKCPFVTEYKHHLEYHLRNHFGSKPFKCDKCSYSCVNKSMLNSHLKSHSNVYQFRCADCTYATKYCHSLKLHLRKYNHNPAMVLNPDGSPNPLPIVDVYGTKRGPKQKPKISPEKSAPPQQQQVSMPMFNPYSLLPTQMPYYNLLNGLTPFPFSQEMKVEEKNNNVEKEITEETKDEIKTPLDLTCSDRGETDKHSTTQVETPVLKNRRKGKAFKLERIPLLLQSQSDEEPEQIVTKPDLYPEECKSPEVKSCEADSEQPKTDKAEKTDEYNCSFCDISFKDIVMYTMHMGYHGYQDPFTCNMCGQQTSDKVSFFLHIARTSHL